MKPRHISILVVLLAALGWCAWLKHEYPHGRRTGCLPVMAIALQVYASEHEGWFPSGAPTPLRSLQLIHEYLGPPLHLAGLSGDEAKVTKRVTDGGWLDDTISSWVYWEGFRDDDDPHLAILWDRTGGLSPNGRRIEPGSHVVVLATGEMRWISARDWPDFQLKQKVLREAIVRERPKAARASRGADERTRP